MRRVSTRVLPEPAAAMTATSVDGVTTAARWRSSRSASRACASIAVTLLAAPRPTRPALEAPPRHSARSRAPAAASGNLADDAVSEEVAQRLRGARGRPAPALVVLRRGGVRPGRLHRPRHLLGRRRRCRLAEVGGGRADRAERAVDARPLLQVAHHEL